MSKWQRMARLVTWISLPVTLLSSALAVELVMTFMAAASKVENAATGHIVPVNDHGYIIYITQTQNLLQNTAFALSMLAGTITICAFFIWQTASEPIPDTVEE